MAYPQTGHALAVGDSTTIFNHFVELKIPDGLAHPLYQMKRYLVASGNMSSQILIDSMTYAQSITTAVADRVLKNNGQPSRPLTSSFERR
jgi:hypothetical protein